MRSWFCIYSVLVHPALAPAFPLQHGRSLSACWQHYCPHTGRHTTAHHSSHWPLGLGHFPNLYLPILSFAGRILIWLCQQYPQLLMCLAVPHHPLLLWSYLSILSYLFCKSYNPCSYSLPTPPNSILLQVYSPFPTL